MTKNDNCPYDLQRSRTDPKLAQNDIESIKLNDSHISNKWADLQSQLAKVLIGNYPIARAHHILQPGKARTKNWNNRTINFLASSKNGKNLKTQIDPNPTGSLGGTTPTAHPTEP